MYFLFDIDPPSAHFSFGLHSDLNCPEKPIFSAPHAHGSAINAIDGCGGLGGVGHGAAELITGGRDGCVRVWDPRVPDAVLVLQPSSAPHTSSSNILGSSGGNVHPGSGTRDCWAVAFGNSFSADERCIAAGYDNGDVKLFDLRSSSMRWEDNVGNGVVSVEFDR